MSEDRVRRALRQIGADVELDGACLADEVAGGKLLRARLVLAAAALGDAPDRERAVRYAILVELIHAGGLLHDDVVDCSGERRGRPTLWSRVGARPAVVAGVGLMVQAGVDLATAPRWLRHVTTDALREVARGQTDDLRQLFSTAVSPEDYRRRARAKTGALYELAARLGAAAGGLDARTTDVVAGFAAAVGLAFQLADDVRDLIGGPALGKAPGSDLRSGVYTLPILLTTSGRHAGGERLRALLQAEMQPTTLAACVDLLAANGALAETVREARALLHQAVAGLAQLPPSPARDTLETYAAELVGALPAGRAAATWSVDGCTEPSGGAREAGHVPFAPTLAVAADPVLSARLGRLVDRAADPARARVAAAGLALALLGDGLPSSWAERATAVGTLDLLLADFFTLVAGLPAPTAETTCRALASTMLAAAERAARAPRHPAFLGDDALAGFVDAVTRAPC